VHRVRSSLVDQRKATANQIRGLTSEYGLIAPKELVHLRAAIPQWLEDLDNGLSERFRCLLRGLWQDMLALDRRVAELDREIEQIARQDPVAVRLQLLRGIGPITATALVATVGDASQFANGRQMAASFGLTPKQKTREEKSGCWASAREVMSTCAVCWCMAHERLFVLPRPRQIE
jgi:transposase